jgi:mortality factor 4-like protein 1
MLKYGEEGLQQQKDLLKQHASHKEPSSSTAKAGKSAASASAAGTSTARGARKDGTRGTKRGRDEVCHILWIFIRGTDI